MATITESWTVADLFEQFGPIPISRVRHDPPPGSATEQDVVDIEVHEERLYELVDGVLLEKTMGFYESYLAMLMGCFVSEFGQNHDLGIVVGEAGMMRLSPGLVRIPDVAFVSWDRLPNRQVPREPIPDLAPDLAVEVLSKGNTPKEMDRKLSDYFQANVNLVWYVDPPNRSVRVFNSADEFAVIAENQSLDGGDLLPGFQLKVSELFREPPNSNTESNY